jgi:hypothetical protein
LPVSKILSVKFCLQVKINDLFDMEIWGRPQDSGRPGEATGTPIFGSIGNIQNKRAIKEQNT